MPVSPDPIIGHHAKPPPPPEIIGGEETYKVINSRFWHRKLQYLVKWKGYGHKENLWLSEGDIDAPELIAEFYEMHPNALSFASIMHCMEHKVALTISFFWPCAMS